MELVAYVRVSTDEQAREGNSLATQESRIRAWAQGMGHEIVAVTADKGVSASIPPFERAGFLDAIEFLKRKEAQGLVATASDRLSRSTVDTLDLAAKFTKKEWALLSMRESLDSSSAMARFTLTMRAAVSELERGLTSERTQEVIAEIKKQHRRYSAILPWGWKAGGPLTIERNGKTLHTMHLVECPEERAASERIIQMTRDGLTAKQTADQLNLEAYHPRLKQPWLDFHVERVIGRLRKDGLRLVRGSNLVKEPKRRRRTES